MHITTAATVWLLPSEIAILKRNAPAAYGCRGICLQVAVENAIGTWYGEKQTAGIDRLIPKKMGDL